jgi:hypothetical protein
MEKEPILTGTFLSGKEKYGSHKSSDTVSLELVIAKIKFKRTIRRLIKMIRE